jgi:hypothetical protein
MKTLVILLAAKGKSEFEHAGDVFKELFDKVGPDRVKALRTDSEVTFPDGLEEAAGAGCECSVVAVASLINDDTILGEHDPGTYWSEYMEMLFRELNIGKPDEELHFHISGGGFWISNMVRGLHSALGGQLWITSLQGSSWKAHNVTLRETGEDMESVTMAALTETWLEGEVSATAKRLQSVSNSVPTPKGVENSLRSAIDGGLVVTGGGGGSVTYTLTDRGALHGLMELASETKRDPPTGAHTGILLLVRATWSKDTLEKYLKEHGLLGKFTKVGLIAVDFSDSANMIELAPQYEKAVLNLKAPDDLVAVDYVSGVLPYSKEDKLERGGVELLRGVHSIVFGESGRHIHWSMPSTGIPAQLRHWTEEYAARSSISIFEVTRKNSGEGRRGAIVYPSGLDNRFHQMALPSHENLATIRAILESDDRYTRPALATLILSEWQGMGAIMRSPKSKSYCARNRVIFSEGHHFREDDDVSKWNTRAYERLGDLGAVFPKRDRFELTPEGRFAASVILRQGPVN